MKLKVLGLAQPHPTSGNLCSHVLFPRTFLSGNRWLFSESSPLPPYSLPLVAQTGDISSISLGF